MGTIEEVRPEMATPIGSRYDSAAAFKVQVLVRFPMAGSMQERWIELRKSSESAVSIEVDAKRWKGASCIVRWNPSNPNQIDADVS